MYASGCSLWHLAVNICSSAEQNSFSFLCTKLFAQYYFCWFLCIWSSSMTEHLEGGKLPKKSIQRNPEFLVWCTEAAAGVAQSSCVHFFFVGGGVLQWHWRRELLSPPSKWNFLNNSHFQILVLPSLLRKESWKAALITFLYQMWDFRTMDSKQSFPPGK